MKRQIHFVLCGSCFWCASDMAGAIERCPACGEAVGAMPVRQPMVIRVRS